MKHSTLKLVAVALGVGFLLGVHFTAGRVINAVPVQLWTMLITGAVIGGFLMLLFVQVRRWTATWPIRESRSLRRERVLHPQTSRHSPGSLLKGGTLSEDEAGDNWREHVKEMQSLRREF